MKKINHKRYLWVLIFVSVQCCTNSIVAQNTADSLYDEANSYYFTNRDSAIIFYKQSLEVRLNQSYSKPDEITDVQQWLGNTENVTVDKVAKTYRNIGICHLENLYYIKANEYLDFSIKIYSISSESEIKNRDLGNAYINKATAYSKLGEYHAAIKAGEDALDLHKKRNDDNIGSLLHIFNLLADIHLKNREYEFALGYCEKAKLLYQSLTQQHKNDYKSEIARIYHTQGFTLHEQKKYESGLKYYRKALKYGIPDSSFTENNIAWLLIDLNRLDEGEDFLNTSLNRKRKQKKVSHHYDYAIPLENFGEIYTRRKEYNTAIEYFDKSLDNLKDNPKSEAPYIYNKPDLLRVLDLKAQAALKAKKIDLAHKTYQDLDNWINEFYKDLSTNQSKLTWIARAHAMYSRAIEVALEKGDKEQAFEYAEKARAVLLWQSHSQQAALSLLDKDKREKYDNLLAQIRQADYEYRNAETTQEKSASKTKLYDSKRGFDQFEMSLGDDYFQRKYQPKTITAQEVQESILNDSTALVEYHWSADDMLYIFTLTKNDIYVDSVRLDSTFHNQIQKYNTAMQGSEGLGESGYPIYQTAFEPIRKHLKNIKKIILLLGGKLNQIPFDALPTKPTSKPPYLIEEYTFNHLYSCSSYPNTSAVDTLRTALYIAPKFDGTNKLFELAPTEITKKLKALNLSTTTLTAAEPTRQRVIDEMADTDILHFHTHAEQGKKGTGKIHLYGGEELSQNDIQASTLKARHVVLSACETGTGELSKGEGVLSLGWSFVYRGVPSVVMSLWNVRNTSTSNLMENYYEYLNEGMSGDEALRQAKLNMLDKHPYHWSAFIHTGNPPTQQYDSNPCKYFLIIGGFLLILLLIYAIRTTKKSQKRNTNDPKTV